MKTRVFPVVAAIASAWYAISISVSAATSTVWEVTGFSDFLKGRLSGLSLTADGTLEPGPTIRWQANLDQPALWSLASAPDGSVYAATGHAGKVFRIANNGTVSTVWTAEQPEVFAIAVTAKGVLYAGSSPNGALYQIQNGKAEEIWRSPAKYIWAIRPASDGALYIATGEPGRVYRIVPGTSAELYYDTGQSNVTALTIGSNGYVYAGTDPNGLLYEITSARQGTVLLDSSLPEIRSIAIDANGYVYAAAMGGAISTRSSPSATPGSASTGAVVATTPTVITVTESKATGIPSDEDQSGTKQTPAQPQPAGSSMSTGTASNTSIAEVSGVQKSAIYRISPNRTVETLRSSKEDNVYDIQLNGDVLLFSTDDRGRIYRFENGKTTLLAEPGTGETTRLLVFGGAWYAGTSNPGRLLASGGAATGASSYESQVHDSSSVARWGHLRWHEASASGAGVVFRTRTGNAVRPDATWSDWSPPITDRSSALIQSPPARFIQWRAEWPSGSTAQIRDVAVPYLPQNGPPVIHSITVSSVISANASKTSSGAATSTTAYSVTVTDTGEAPAVASTTSETQTVTRLQTTQTQISWQADDPDNDKLVYSVYFRAEDEKDWQLVRSRMFENTLLLDPDVFADGRYYFRVVASDAPSNAPEYARETEMVSPPVLIDNTPPVVTLGEPHRDGPNLDIDIDAADKTSPLRLCEYSLDAGFWQPIEAVDGITDSPRERFHLHLDKLRPGEHLLVFRVYDSANNAGLARVVLK